MFYYVSKTSQNFFELSKENKKEVLFYPSGDLLDLTVFTESLENAGKR